MSSIFFIENILPSEEENKKNVVLYNATMHYEQLQENASQHVYDERISDEYFTLKSVQLENLLSLNACRYVSISDQGYLRNANKSHIARHYITQNNFIRGTLSSLDSFPFDNSSATKFYSFHVNVGHGNCSFVVNEKTKEIILVDCGEYDYLNHVNYRSNIQHCLDHIQKKFNISNLHIGLFILTHIHYDHYSGIEHLIDCSIIDNRSVGVFCQHYSMPSPKFNDLIKKIKQKNISAIDPFFIKNSNLIKILYPRKIIVRTKTKNNQHLNPVVETNPNNASIVFNLNSSNKSFLFTGDIETKGLNSINNCSPYFNNADFFAIPHHGSITGFYRNVCNRNLSISNVSNCLKTGTIPVLMGRDGAYRGVYSSTVTNTFSNIIYSEKNPQGNTAEFVELDWNTGQSIWF